MNWINEIKLKIIWLCEYILSFIAFVISIFKKMKKPVITGMLAAGLLVAPMKNAESINFYFTRAPPTYADEYLKKEYPYEWKMIMKAWEEGVNSRPAWPYQKVAINALEKRYKKDKKLVTLYLLAYVTYFYAASMPSFEETEDKLLESLEYIEKGLKERPNELFFADFKLEICYTLVDIYYRAYKGDPEYENENIPDLYKKDEHKKNALKYSNKFIEFGEEMKGKINQLRPTLFNLSEEDKSEYIKQFKKNFQEKLKDIKRIQAELQNENNK